MLDYSLCKKLKDAGFKYPVLKQEGGAWSWNTSSRDENTADGCFHCGDHFRFWDESGDILWSSLQSEFDVDCYYCPTLSELIEACVGSGAMTINLTAEGCGVWWGTKQARKTFAEGQTPEEAVANLYLALQNES